jgi:hypothetical protein
MRSDHGQRSIHRPFCCSQFKCRHCDSNISRRTQRVCQCGRHHWVVFRHYRDCIAHAGKSPRRPAADLRCVRKRHNDHECYMVSFGPILQQLRMWQRDAEWCLYRTCKSPCSGTSHGSGDLGCRPYQVRLRCNNRCFTRIRQRLSHCSSGCGRNAGAVHCHGIEHKQHRCDLESRRRRMQRPCVRHNINERTLHRALCRSKSGTSLCHGNLGG